MSSPLTSTNQPTPANKPSRKPSFQAKDNLTIRFGAKTKKSSANLSQLNWFQKSLGDLWGEKDMLGLAAYVVCNIIPPGGRLIYDFLAGPISRLIAGKDKGGFFAQWKRQCSNPENPDKNQVFEDGEVETLLLGEAACDMANGLADAASHGSFLDAFGDFFDFF